MKCTPWKCGEVWGAMPQELYFHCKRLFSSACDTRYLAGEGPNQMDAAHETFKAFPFMIALMLGHLVQC